MSGNTYSNDYPQIYKNNWPPTEDLILDIASNALNISQDKDFNVFVFSDKINNFIFDDVDLKGKKYIKRNYNHYERNINVFIIKNNF